MPAGPVGPVVSTGLTGAVAVGWIVVQLAQLDVRLPTFEFRDEATTSVSSEGFSATETRLEMNGATMVDM